MMQGMNEDSVCSKSQDGASVNGNLYFQPWRDAWQQPVCQC